jgi:SAM-dependent methyltransferase
MKCAYKKFAKYYDLIYSKKDYALETKFLFNEIKRNKITGKSVLEVGCGTGGHAVYLKNKKFEITGIDLNKEMLAVARKKSKSIKFLQGDMRNFNLKKKFDIVLCLFSTMHYNQNYSELKKTLKNYYNHLEKSDLLIFDMGFNRERIKNSKSVVNHEFNETVDLVRFSKSRLFGNYCYLDMAYMIFKNNKFTYADEVHKMRIFETLKVKKILEQIGFKVDLFEYYTSKKWTKISKKYVVFSCVKK